MNIKPEITDYIGAKKALSFVSQAFRRKRRGEHPIEMMKVKKRPKKSTLTQTAVLLLVAKS